MYIHEDLQLKPLSMRFAMLQTFENAKGFVQRISYRGINFVHFMFKCGINFFSCNNEVLYM